MNTLRLHAAAALLHCSPERLRAMCKARIVPSTKIGRSWILIEQLLWDWIDGGVSMRTDVDAAEVFNWARRRSGLADRTPAWADHAAIYRIYRECRRLTKVTGIRHNVDHTIPLHGRNVSGLHVENNLAILSAFANRSKGNKFP